VQAISGLCVMPNPMSGRFGGNQREMCGTSVLTLTTEDYQAQACRQELRMVSAEPGVPGTLMSAELDKPVERRLRFVGSSGSRFITGIRRFGRCDRRAQHVWTWGFRTARVLTDPARKHARPFSGRPHLLTCCRASWRLPAALRLRAGSPALRHLAPSADPSSAPGGAEARLVLPWRGRVAAGSWRGR